MESIIIHSNSKKDLNLLQQLAEKMGLEAHLLTRAEKENLAFAKCIQANNPAENLMMEDAVAYYNKLNKAD